MGEERTGLTSLQVGAGALLATYEVRTLKVRGRLSLSGKIECASDVAAIVVARQLMRVGETVEVWRGDKLIYRVLPRAR